MLNRRDILKFAVGAVSAFGVPVNALTGHRRLDTCLHPVPSKYVRLKDGRRGLMMRFKTGWRIVSLECP